MYRNIHSKRDWFHTPSFCYSSCPNVVGTMRLMEPERLSVGNWSPGLIQSFLVVFNAHVLFHVCPRSKQLYLLKPWSKVISPAVMTWLFLRPLQCADQQNVRFYAWVTVGTAKGFLMINPGRRSRGQMSLSPHHDRCPHCCQCGVSWVSWLRICGFSRKPPSLLFSSK